MPQTRTLANRRESACPPTVLNLSVLPHLPPSSVVPAAAPATDRRRVPRSGNAKTSGRSGRDLVVVPAASRWVRPYCAAAAMADAIRGQRLLDFPVDLFLGLRGGASLR
ncbi:hypothetical protein PVAP13_2NG624250 [Panicum virgatum]|uniref:Uncharacterized protein n=1 Tax=Panicum virgatum TaxID=38727 RepID=A0A8T0VRX6_PANVG|nr:hypothetical protein PVAP13_2NG624250 [Panicum virgatum]